MQVMGITGLNRAFDKISIYNSNEAFQITKTQRLFSNVITQKRLIWNIYTLIVTWFWASCNLKWYFIKTTNPVEFKTEKYTVIITFWEKKSIS